MVQAQYKPAPPAPYDVALRDAVVSVRRSNICLIARMTHLSGDENSGWDETGKLYDTSNQNLPTCQLNLSGLKIFAESYTNILGTQPYSGAESFRNFTATLLEAEALINDAGTKDDLNRAQTKLSMSLSEVIYWLCGLDWYLQRAPFAEPVQKQNIGSAALSPIWDEWDQKHDKSVSVSVARRKNYQQADDGGECSGFIDLID